MWTDAGTWKKAWLASDREGVFLTRDAMDTLKPVSDDVLRFVRKQGIRPRMSAFGAHPARFDSIYAFFNFGPRMPTGVARGDGRFFVSMDGGQSWRGIGSSVDAAWFSADANTIVVAVDKGRLLRSLDGGGSFAHVADVSGEVLRQLGPDALGRPMELRIPRVRVEPSGRMVATWYVLLQQQGQGPALGDWGEAWSVDGGQSWAVNVSKSPLVSTASLPGAVEGIPAPRMEPFFRVTPAGVQRLSAAGAWQTLVLKPTLGSVIMMAAHPSGTGTFALAETGLFRQDPESRLWVPLHPPEKMLHETVQPGVPGVAGPHPEAYRPLAPDPEEIIFRHPMGMQVDAEDPSHLYLACGPDGLYEVHAQGKQFKARSVFAGAAFGSLAQDAVEPRFLYSGGMGEGGILWSHDKGTSWRITQRVAPGTVRFVSPPVEGLPTWALVFDAQRPTALLEALVSNDHGGSWRTVPPAGAFGLEELLDLTYRGGQVWAMAREGWKPALLSSPNGGSSWTRVAFKPVSALNRHTRLHGWGQRLVAVGMEPRVVSLRGSKKFADAVALSSPNAEGWGAISEGLPREGKVMDFTVTPQALFMLLGDPQGENTAVWEYR